jgi:UPF0716 protein FxsA
LRPSSPFLGLAAFAGWIALEIIAFNLVASWTGGGVAFFLLVMKSVVGALVVKRIVSRKILDVLRRGGRTVILEGREATEAWLKGLGGALLIVPGFVSGLAGLALLTPSVRRALASRGGGRAADPRDIDLDSGDWREIEDDRRGRIRRQAPARDH